MDSFCRPWVTTATLSYRFHIFETSATALCGTTGISHEPTPFFIDGLVDSSLLVSLQWPSATTDTEDSDQKTTSPRSFGAISTWKKTSKTQPRVISTWQIRHIWHVPFRGVSWLSWRAWDGRAETSQSSKVPKWKSAKSQELSLVMLGQSKCIFPYVHCFSLGMMDDYRWL